MKVIRYIVTGLILFVTLLLVVLILSCQQIGADENLTGKLRHKLDRFEQQFKKEFTGKDFSLDEIREMREERRRKYCERVRELDDYDPELDGCDEDEEWED